MDFFRQPTTYLCAKIPTTTYKRDLAVKDAPSIKATHDNVQLNIVNEKGKTKDIQVRLAKCGFVRQRHLTEANIKYVYGPDARASDKDFVIFRDSIKNDVYQWQSAMIGLDQRKSFFVARVDRVGVFEDSNDQPEQSPGSHNTLLRAEEQLVIRYTSPAIHCYLSLVSHESCRSADDVHLFFLLPP
ncbi:hypothetical protein EJ03DRAFT_56829 [Teratosphaeria nubilosa]|uniref:Uncharacterized protein n=1 Tax=Teratosphaeria nubilosa TaxID=161662 RepID=A0A6G1LD46_9PEZI|nr:hypothetical protein EJ03DRAFT_56829 [Teratosphaeria nubilosa]